MRVRQPRVRSSNYLILRQSENDQDHDIILFYCRTSITVVLRGENGELIR